MENIGRNLETKNNIIIKSTESFLKLRERRSKFRPYIV